jgi:8-oxo-dGTP pyrophosphatase MutT (NUDIX family)
VLIHRRAGRVVVLDDQDRVLLLRGMDPAIPDRGSWWFTPGGGLDPGESSADAARRELREETGLFLADLGQIIYERVARFDFDGASYEQAEAFYLVRVPSFEPTSDGWTDVEKRSVTACRWWSLAELETTSEHLHPQELPQIVRKHLPGSRVTAP